MESMPNRYEHVLGGADDMMCLRAESIHDVSKSFTNVQPATGVRIRSRVQRDPKA